MKKKILSLALACLMIMAAIVTAIPVFADAFETDAKAVEAGMVCRIGEEGTGTYYDDFAEAYTAAASGDTITIINDVTYGSTSTSQNNLQLNNDSGKGNNAVLTIKSEATGDDRPTFTIVNGGFIVGNGVSQSCKMTIENLIIKQGVAHMDFSKSGTNSQAIAQIRGNCVLTFNNCDITVPGIRNANAAGIGGFLNFGTGNNSSRGTLNMSSCTMNFTNTEYVSTTSGGASTKPAFVFQGNATGTINLTDVTIKSASEMRVFSLLNKWIVNLNGTNTFELADRDENATSEIFAPYNNSATNAAPTISNVKVNVNGSVISNAETLIASDLSGTTFNVTSGTAFGDYTAPTLEAGASVRTTEGSNGLRFTANYTGNAAEYGIIAAATADTLTSSIFTTALGSEKYVKAASTEDGFNKTDDGTYNIVLTKADMTGEFYEKQFSARAYATYNIGNNGVTVTVYSAYTEADNARTMKYVATAALADVKTEAELQAMDSAEAAKYTCKITDDGATKYSRYSEAQRDVLATIAA